MDWRLRDPGEIGCTHRNDIPQILPFEFLQHASYFVFSSYHLHPFELVKSSTIDRMFLASGMKEGSMAGVFISLSQTLQFITPKQL